MSPPTTSQPGRQRDWLFRGWTSWAIPLALLALTILLAETTPWDEQIQNLFYSPERGWLLTLDKHRGFGLVYYTIPVRLIGAVSGLLLLSSLWTLLKTRRFPWKRAYVLLCMAAIPTLVANLKSRNSMPYPKKILQYGGTCPKRSLLQAFPHPTGSQRETLPRLACRPCQRRILPHGTRLLSRGPPKAPVGIRLLRRPGRIHGTLPHHGRKPLLQPQSGLLLPRLARRLPPLSRRTRPPEKIFRASPKGTRPTPLLKPAPRPGRTGRDAKSQSTDRRSLIPHTYFPCAENVTTGKLFTQGEKQKEAPGAPRKGIV